MKHVAMLLLVVFACAGCAVFQSSWERKVARAERDYAKAKEMYAAGHYEKAVALFESSIEVECVLHPSAVWPAMAEAYDKAGLPEEALRCYLHTRKSTYVYSPKNQAIRRSAEGVEKAIALEARRVEAAKAERALAAQPDDLGLQIALARAYMAVRDTHSLDKCRAVLDRAVAEHPKDARAYVWRAELEMLTCEISQADADYTAADKLDPGNAQLLYLHGHMDAGVSEREFLTKAIDLYGQAIAKDPSVDLYYRGRAEAILEMVLRGWDADSRQGMEDCNKWIELTPVEARRWDCIDAYAVRAMMRPEDQYGKALDDIDYALEYAETHRPELYFYKGKLMLAHAVEQYDYDRAYEWFTYAIEGKYPGLEAYYMRALASVGAGRPVAAQADYARVQAVVPDLPALDLDRARDLQRRYALDAKIRAEEGHAEWEEQQRRIQQEKERIYHRELAERLEARQQEQTAGAQAQDVVATTKSDTIDWSGYKSHVEDIGGMIDRNEAASGATQQRIDDDARWSRYLRDLERNGHANSQAQ